MRILRAKEKMRIVRRSGRLHGPNVRWLKSPNFDQRPNRHDISLLVIHNISLPPGEFGGCHVDDLFQNTLDPSKHPYFKEICNLKVSSHILIDRLGEIVQYVPFHKRAWHAGKSEFMGKTACNDFSIGIELEGSDDEPFELVQYHKLAEIIESLLQTYPYLSRQNIVGHSDIAPGRKTDPGPHFDWAKLEILLNRRFRP